MRARLRLLGFVIHLVDQADAAERDLRPKLWYECLGRLARIGGFWSTRGPIHVTQAFYDVLIGYFKDSAPAVFDHGNFAGLTIHGKPIVPVVELKMVEWPPWQP